MKKVGSPKSQGEKHVKSKVMAKKWLHVIHNYLP